MIDDLDDAKTTLVIDCGYLYTAQPQDTNQPLQHIAQMIGARSLLRSRVDRAPRYFRAVGNIPARPNQQLAPILSAIRSPTHRFASDTTMPDKSSQPEDNATLTANFKVLPSDLASATSPDAGDSYAKVLATPRLVAFMEIVCARMLVPHQPSGQVSVGTRVEMDHLAATPVDEQISVTAKFLRKEGKQFVFETEITDKGGVIGKGNHRRAMIDESRLIAGAKKRMGGSSKI